MAALIAHNKSTREVLSRARPPWERLEATRCTADFFYLVASRVSRSGSDPRF